MLLRAIYIRDGEPRGITFVHSTAESGTVFAERLITSFKRFWPDSKLLTVLNGRPTKPRQSPEDIARQHTFIANSDSTR